MAIRSYQLGPGLLTFTPVGGGAARSAETQVTKCAVVPVENVTSTDPIPVLSGEELTVPDSVSHRATLDFTVLQDLETTGFLTWTWTNKGTLFAFEFLPATGPQKVQGHVRVAPLTLGGDVKTRPTSDASWFACQLADQSGIPVLVPVP